MRPPNILFIITDQQRADSLGVVNGWASTPNLDGLAKQGCRFTSCFTNSPVCVPARFSLMSGLYPHNFGIQRHLNIEYPLELETWVNRLRTQGYRTSMFGKIHLHPERTGVRRGVRRLKALGFDDANEVTGPRSLTSLTGSIAKEWAKHGVLRAYRHDKGNRFRTKPWLVRPSPVGVDLYYDTYVARSATHHLAGLSHSAPWFCYVGFPGPHEPWDAPRPWDQMYKPEDMPLPIPAPVSEGPRPRGELDKRLASHPDISPSEIAAMRANYAGEVSLIDSLIGELFDAVKARGEWENTVVIFTSDHGELNGDANLIYKQVFLDGAAHVPLIVREPGTPSRLVSDPVELMDVGPTVLDLAGCGTDGRYGLALSLADVIRGKDSSGPRNEALSEFKGEVMLATRDHKIVLNADGDAYLLFDRSTDERINLVGHHDLAGIEQDLRVRALQRLMTSSTQRPLFQSSKPRRFRLPRSVKKKLRRFRVNMLRDSMAQRLHRNPTS